MIVGRKLSRPRHPLKLHVNRPVFLRLEGTDLFFAIHHQPSGHRLHTACGQAPSNLFPQQRRQLIAHNAVQNAPGLLGIHQILVNGPWILNTGVYHILCDLIKCNTMYLILVQIQQVFQVPRNCLSLTVRVSCQIHALNLFSGFSEIGNYGFLALQRHILGLKIVIDIYTHFAFGQVPQMAHAGLYLIIRAQIFSYGLRLCR